MSTARSPLHVLGICGSLRTDSWNRKLRATAESFEREHLASATDGDASV